MSCYQASTQMPTQQIASYYTKNSNNAYATNMRPESNQYAVNTSVTSELEVSKRENSHSELSTLPVIVERNLLDDHDHVHLHDKVYPSCHASSNKENMCSNPKSNMYPAFVSCQKAQNNAVKLCYKIDQLELLNAIYNEMKYPNSVQKTMIANIIGITREQTKV